MTLARGYARLDSWPIRRTLVLHRGREILVVRPRIDAFQLRSVVVLNGDDGVYGLRPAPFHGARLRRALSDAGFDLVEHPTTFRLFPRPPF